MSVLSPVACVLGCSVMSNYFNPVDCNPPGSSVHGILQARILGRVPFPSPGHLSHPGTETVFPAFPTHADGLFTTMPPGKPPLPVGILCIYFGDAVLIENLGI